MEKIGIITYHAGYNFGSMLQAYATQEAIKKLGYMPKMINYRMKEQRYFYNCLYRFKYGPRTAIKDLLQFPIANKRKVRLEAFESFLQSHMDLTKDVVEPQEVYDLWSDYECLISGSDQIWNKNSLELYHNDQKYMDPYLLKGFTGQKVSYASSVGSMTDEMLQRILPDIQKFDAISFRERSAAQRMENMLGRSVNVVLDPTLLLTKEEWAERLGLHYRKEPKYILYYSLHGGKKLLLQRSHLLSLAKRKNCRLRIVMPFIYLPSLKKRIEIHSEYGPQEFLDAIYNAEMVITDSYHGTVFSVNFGKPFLSICGTGKAEYRKTDILKELGLSDHIVGNTAEVLTKPELQVDWQAVYAKLHKLQRYSMEYLQSALVPHRESKAL